MKLVSTQGARQVRGTILVMGTASAPNPVTSKAHDHNTAAAKPGAQPPCRQAAKGEHRRRFDLSREDAEEALQRAATAIVFAAPSVRSPEAYLTSVFLRECLGAWRRRQDVQKREISMPDGFQRADDACERIEVVCRFRSAFARLSPYCRSVMRSCLLEGKSRVAGSDAPVSEGAIYKRYRKCLRTLADALG